MFEVAPRYYNFTRDCIDRWAAQRPDAMALWCVDESTRTEYRYTFSGIAGYSRRAADFFSKLGIAQGDRVIIMLPRIPQFWLAMLGLVRLGAVPIPSPTLLTKKDLDYRIAAAGVKAIIADDANSAKAEDFAGVKVSVGSHRPGWCDFDDGLRDGNPEFEGPLTLADDPGIIYFTSGTTGHPKMALHSQVTYALGHKVTAQLWLDLRPTDIHWALADTGWAKTAWSNFYGPWQCGACVFVLDSRTKFSPGAVLRVLSHYPITTFCSPPTALRLIVADHDLHKYKFPHLRHCVAAGEALNADVLTKWKSATGLDIYEGYGQTETIVLIANHRSMGNAIRPGSMGKPTPGFDIQLVDEGLNELQGAAEGQIAIRVKPNRPLGMFKEYWRNPEETALRFRGEWYLTGDVARRDAEGYYWFVGRADDVINSASYRIGPFEVESALAEHPAVLEVAVVGAPDRLRGEIVKAFVVLKKGFEASDTLKHELQEHCKTVTAPYKYPRLVEFVTELPKTISGKIRRVELKARG